MHPKVANQFDIVILDSGSTAFAAALRAAESGKTAAMTEARTLGDQRWQWFSSRTLGRPSTKANRFMAA